MNIAKFGYISVNEKELKDILLLCLQNDDKVEYDFNSEKYGNFIDIYIPIKEYDPKAGEYLAELFKNYLNEIEQKQISNREIEHIKFYNEIEY